MTEKDATFWVVQHKESGRFLPRFPGQGGGTIVDFKDDYPPRLFESRASAKMALRWWLKGMIIGGQRAEFKEEVLHVPERKREECRIVRARLELLEDGE